MGKTRDFEAEYKAFLQKYPYKIIEVNGIKIRYQYGGKEGAPVILFFHGLEMQEMWMSYALHFSENYRFLIYEYPLHTVIADEQIDFAKDLLKKLSIEQVSLLGGKLCKDEGCPELAKYLCRYDYLLADIMGMELKRTGTIAEGYDKCDFRYSRK